MAQDTLPRLSPMLSTSHFRERPEHSEASLLPNPAGFLFKPVSPPYEKRSKTDDGQHALSQCRLTAENLLPEIFPKARRQETARGGPNLA